MAKSFLVNARAETAALETHIYDVLEALGDMEGVYEADCTATLSTGDVITSCSASR